VNDLNGRENFVSNLKPFCFQVTFRANNGYNEPNYCPSSSCFNTIIGNNNHPTKALLSDSGEKKCDVQFLPKPSEKRLCLGR